jgi:hypothetical protein
LEAREQSAHAVADQNHVVHPGVVMVGVPLLAVGLQAIAQARGGAGHGHAGWVHEQQGGEARIELRRAEDLIDGVLPDVGIGIQAMDEYYRDLVPVVGAHAKEADVVGTSLRVEQPGQAVVAQVGAIHVALDRGGEVPREIEPA